MPKASQPVSGRADSSLAKLTGKRVFSPPLHQPVLVPVGRSGSCRHAILLTQTGAAREGFLMQTEEVGKGANPEGPARLSSQPPGSF